MNLLYALLILQVLDMCSTVVALRNPLLAEGNPLLKPLFDRFGALPTMVVVKVGFMATVWAAQDYIHPIGLWVLLAFYSWVVYNNIKLIVSTK